MWDTDASEVAGLENDRAEGFQLQDTKDAQWQGRQRKCTVCNGLHRHLTMCVHCRLKLLTPDMTGYMPLLQNILNNTESTAITRLQPSLSQSRLNPLAPHILETELLWRHFTEKWLFHSIFSSHSAAAQDNGTLLYALVVLSMWTNVLESQFNTFCCYKPWTEDMTNL